jgi:hypothetical protein
MARGTSQVDFEAALQDPKAFFAEPQDVAGNPQLSRDEKLAILRQWEQDALRRQHLNQRIWVVVRRTCPVEWNAQYGWYAKNTTDDET